MTLLLLLGAVLLAAHLLHALAGPHGAVVDRAFADWVYTAIQVAGVTVCLAGALTRGRERAAWLWLTVGLIAWVLGDLAWTLWLNHVAEPPYPSVADGLYLFGYLALYVGLVLLLRLHTGSTRRSDWLVGAIAGCAVAAVGAALIFQPVLDASEGNASAIAVNLAYPLGDLVLMALVVAAFAARRWRPDRTWLLIGAGIATGALGDAIYMYQASVGSYVAGSLIDSTWPATMLLMAVAAWLPAPRSRPRHEGLELTLVPVFFVLVAVGLLAYGYFDPLTPLATGLAFAAILVAVVRGAFTSYENLAMMRRVQGLAHTDALSGLPNRRQLISDLEDALADDGIARTLVFFDLDGFKHYNDQFGHAAGDQLLVRLSRRLKHAVAEEGAAYRLGGDEFCVLVEGTDPNVVEHAAHALRDRGDGFTIRSSYGAVRLPDEAREPSEALRLADQRMYADKRSSRPSDSRQARDVLVTVLDERDARLHEHMDSVAHLARRVAVRMGMRGEDLDVLVRAAELHDVGKIAIPEQVLDKPGPLESAEWSLLRQHTLIGERILASAPALRPVASIVRASHERWDGNGYPDGLAGEEIPLASRIVAVCDAFDAMVTERVYRRAGSVEGALTELRRCAGDQFDPTVVDAFCAEVGEQRDRAPAADAASLER